jgi:hypothetical protein
MKKIASWEKTSMEEEKVMQIKKQNRPPELIAGCNNLCVKH